MAYSSWRKSLKHRDKTHTPEIASTLVLVLRYAHTHIHVFTGTLATSVFGLTFFPSRCLERLGMADPSSSYLRWPVSGSLCGSTMFSWAPRGDRILSSETGCPSPFGTPHQQCPLVLWPVLFLAVLCKSSRVSHSEGQISDILFLPEPTGSLLDLETRRRRMLETLESGSRKDSWPDTFVFCPHLLRLCTSPWFGAAARGCRGLSLAPTTRLSSFSCFPAVPQPPYRLSVPGTFQGGSCPEHFCLLFLLSRTPFAQLSPVL